MSRHEADQLSEWIHSEKHYHPNDEALAATRFFLGNGLIGVRGSLDELGTHGVQGCYAAGFFRKRLVHQFETADTYTRKKFIFDEEIMPQPAEIYEIQGLPDLLFCRITIGGEVVRLWEGSITTFERTLDLRRGLMTRKLEWTSPKGLRAELNFERFLSWSSPELLFQRITIRALDAFDLEIAPGLDWGLEPRLTVGKVDCKQSGWAFTATAQGSGISAYIGQAWALEVNGESADMDMVPGELSGRPLAKYRISLAQGHSLSLTRISSILVDNHPAASAPSSEKAFGKAAEALRRGFDAGLAASAEVLSAKWNLADIRIDGAGRAQLGLRYSLYQLLAAAPWDYDHISIAAKCLSGPGYNGHVFWDTDINILPFYQWVFPEVAANHCRYRHRMLDDARKLAAKENRPGAR